MYFDILGMVGLDLQGEGGKPRNYLRKEYGKFEVSNPSGHNPDVSIELVDDVSSEEASVHVRGPVAYDNKGVFLHHNLPGDVEYNACRINFDSIGQGVTKVTCDRNFNSHFFAIIVDYLIHIHLLEHDATFCHSCGFTYNGKVIVCPAWRHVGKTNLLLTFRKEGVNYIADDWSVLHRNGTVSPLPKRLNLLYYNFIRYPGLLDQASEDLKSLVKFINRAKAGEIDLNKKVIDTLTDQARMRVKPEKIFDDVESHSKPIDYLFMLKRSHSNECEVTRQNISPDTFHYRNQSILEFEQSHFHLAYEVHKSHTGKVNSYLEQMSQNSLEILQNTAKKTQELYEITVPSQDASEEVKKIIKETIHEQ